MGKPVPSFWWDFSYGPDAVIVESDDERHPVVASWPGHSTRNIGRAEKLIKDIKLKEAAK